MLRSARDDNSTVVTILFGCGISQLEVAMNHKRKRPKSARAGCLLCKPHKANGCCADHKNMQHGNRRRYEGGREQLRCEGLGSL
ncbi:MAG: hypothetical protein DI537_20215 [Stutzerimonas stutzeri]|nr:MAG: hypothetical protein DI537_20215 [Stutzerimonas stutzeri]